LGEPLDRIDQLFDLLDRWRHLPAYQLERRADVLFAMYLPAFLSDHLGVPIRPELIPEFPVRQGSIYPDGPEKNRNLSCKIDYLAMSQDGSRVWFLELKTDGLSRRQRQDDYLLRAQAAGMPALSRGLLQIFAATEAKSKYVHLLKLADSVGLLTLPKSFHDRVADRSGWRGIGDDLAAVRIDEWPREISIVYLQPHQAEAGEIGFNQLADWLERFEDVFSRKFRESLRRWAQSPAGVELDAGPFQF
jgi:hypothetical protein